jgi:hypothetical protein
MAAAGAYLFEPSLIQLDIYVERGKYALAGYTLIYAALLVAFAAMAGVLRTGVSAADFVLSLFTGPLALFGLGAMFSVLAGDALFFRDPVNFWVGLLAIPAALCFAASSLAEKAEKIADEEDTESVLDDDADDGASRGGGLPGLLFWFVTFVTITLVAVFLAIQAGFALFYLLRANLLDGRDIDVARIGPMLLDLAYNVVSEQWIFVVVTAGLLGALVFVFIAASAFLTRGKPERQINDDEATALWLYAAQLRAYAEARRYSQGARRLLWLVILPSLLAPMAILIAVALPGASWLAGPYNANALAEFGWHIYEHRMGFSIVVLVFAALLWGAAPNAILSRLSRSYSERAGWSGFATGRLSVEDHLAKQYAAGALALDQPFDPGAFLHRVNIAFEPRFLFPAVPLTLAGAILAHHDTSRYHLLTERHIEVMGYWSLEKHRFAYDQVQRVVLGCAYSKNGREDATYSLVLPDGFSIELFRKGPENNIGDLAKVDAKIGQNVPRSFAVRTPLFRPDESRYDALCVETLAASLREPDGDRFRVIFRAEEWQRQRWEQRTSPPK